MKRKVYHLINSPWNDQSQKVRLTECNIFVDHSDYKWTIAWEAVTCGNCKRTHYYNQQKLFSAPPKPPPPEVQPDALQSILKRLGELQTEVAHLADHIHTMRVENHQARGGSMLSSIQREVAEIALRRKVKCTCTSGCKSSTCDNLRG